MLKNKYSISLVKMDSLEKILELLHSNYVKKYTNNTIEQSFGQDFIYSFVFDKEILESVISMGNPVILPKSLEEKIDLKKTISNVFVDEGF